MELKLYATIGIGLETIVQRELNALGISQSRVQPGRVIFSGSMDDLFRSLIHLRCASRVIRELADGEISSDKELYQVAREIEWSRHFTPDMTFRIQFHMHSRLYKNSMYGTHRIKDAICDYFMDHTGRRPCVDADAPDIYVECYLKNRRLSIGLDAAGAPLHMRGYRRERHEATLKEHLAAALVLQSRWEPSRPFHDPFCGSGSILLEAAMIATRTPPTFLRPRFACEKWPDIDIKRLAALREEARAHIHMPESLRLSGGDIDSNAIEAALRNTEAAGFSSAIVFRTEAIADMAPVHDGHIVTNPPYGERLEDKESVLDIFRSFRERLLLCRGSIAAVLNAHLDFEKTLSLKPFKKNRINNGPIPCTLYQYQIRPA
jgi:23S rRNA G2445 N2-methylase RlmL